MSKATQHAQSPEFIEAKTTVDSFKKAPTQEDMLELYGLYKYSLFGPNTASKPGFMDPKGQYKWKAYTTVSDREGMTPQLAQKEYVEYVEKIKSKYANA